MTNQAGNKIALIRKWKDAADREPALWALQQLSEALTGKRVEVVASDSEEQAAEADLCVIVGVGDAGSDAAGQPTEPESFACIPMTSGGRRTLAVVGADVRGLVYALLELADRVRHAEDALGELLRLPGMQEQPANAIRSIKRLFVNEQVDKPWFYDRAFWQAYLTELATQRFNRFNLALGIGYDLGHDPDIKDDYFCFAYPFFVAVPGYEVRVEGLPDEERERNLDMLRYIGGEARRRGLDFHLGLWTHAYEPADSPDLRYRIGGVHRGNHAEYCRDALKTLLQACPAIDGVTIRVHYESGIPEPAHLFWQVVLQGAALCGRDVKLDLHPKGIDDELLRVAEDNGLPFAISPKFWAEHMGLPYHQAEIRETELPIEPHPEAGSMIITITSRRFTRYGYADFLKEDRKYDVFFRIWPGTQRVLLWGDPDMAAGYGRSGSFGGAKGIEWMEPLSFKSRKTTETPDGRDPYADPALRFDGQEWRKYEYGYRLWGRLSYNPEADPDGWRRYLKSEFADAAEACEHALKWASRVLPLVTVAHHPSAANNHYWPEIYHNNEIVHTGQDAMYNDSPEPHTFNVVSPLDPALFYGVDEFAGAVLDNRVRGKLSPLETANRLDGMAASAEQYLEEAKRRMDGRQSRSFRRWSIDIEAQIGLGRFFADKFRAGTAYAWFEKLGAAELLEQALAFYRSAQKHWEQVAEVTRFAYTHDITFGYNPFMRGHWADRVQAIERDIANMEKQRSRAASRPSRQKVELVQGWLRRVPDQPLYACRHTPAASFKRGETVSIFLAVSPAANLKARLEYRHANQAESFQSVEMERAEGGFAADIPSSCTDSPYPLVYLFEIEDTSSCRKFPGFNDSLSNQPYYVIRQSNG